MLALRTTDGIDLVDFERRFGVDLVATNRALVERSVAGGLLRHEPGRLAPAVKGLAMADGLAAAFETGRADRHDLGCDSPPADRGRSDNGMRSTA